LIIKLAGDRELRVTVPREAKVTFGPAIPAPTRGYTDNGGLREYAVRIYNGAT
jgi:hypothetical protein